jgi:hypothetical protein|tara:strand:+ start:870 stop:1079 length:210 start_codon:yes stop_codon:yes gene_type:complete
MKKPKNKLTYKQMLGIIAQMDKTVQTSQSIVFNLDKLLQEYIEYKKETESFKKFLEKKYDNNNEEVKEK